MLRISGRGNTSEQAPNDNHTWPIYFPFHFPPSTLYRTSAMPPKGSRKTTAPVTANTLVLDNGAYTIKAGLVSTSNADPSYESCHVAPNCIARSVRDKCSYTASELIDCKDFGELAFRRPVEKGFVVNWEAEKAIWEHEFIESTAVEGLRVGMTSPPREQVPAQD